MNDLQQRAQAFERLLATEYKMIIGRKGKTVTIVLRFQADHFHHLAGLHKLTDLRIARARRQQAFDAILQGRLTDDDLRKSASFEKIAPRLHHLLDLETLLDSNELVFRYNPKRDPYSAIQSDYLLVTPKGADTLYIFIAKEKEQDVFFCRSFFPKTGKDYTKGQAKYTLLYKEKINRKTGETIVQYDRLTPKS